MVVTVEGYGVFDDLGTVGTGIPKCLTLEKDGGQTGRWPARTRKTRTLLYLVIMPTPA